jgi:hypothetical protein
VKFNRHSHQIFHVDPDHVSELGRLLASRALAPKSDSANNLELMTTLCHSQALEKQI